MSLINEALKRARSDAERQADAERGGGAPSPAWTPPPFVRRERSPVAASLLASLAVSVAVGLGFYFFLHRRAEEPRAAPAADNRPLPVTAPASPVLGAPEPNPRSAGAPSTGDAGAPPRAATRRPAATPPARDVSPRPTTPAPQAPEPTAAAQPTRTLTLEPVSGNAPALPTARAPGDSGGPHGRVFTGEATLPSGAKITLGGIISGAIPLAMLDGRMIGIGEFAGDCALVKIEARQVELRCPSGTLWIRLP